jgi:glucans biosynthesis protein
VQRARDFDHYQDAEARYEQRPSAWVEPAEPWGRGSIVLTELPTGDEFTDNIVAFWRPEAPLLAGEERRFAYRLTWGMRTVEELPLARVIATRGGGSILDATERVFVVDFDLGMINFATVEPMVEASGGEVKGLSIAPLPGGNIARVGFHLIPGEILGAEFRLWLVSEGQIASEVWLYRWTA